MEPSTGSGRLSPAWRVALVAFASTRIPLMVFAWVIHKYRPHTLREGHFLYHGGEPHGSWLVDAFQKWDSYWLLNIVREGYQYFGPMEQIQGVVAGRPETNITPFPLYPLLTKAVSFVTGDPAVAGLLVSQICLLLALVLLYRLARVDLSAEGSVLAVWLFALVPWTYAFSAIHTESLFFALAVGSMLAVRRDRLLLGCSLAMLAALTRLPGALLVIPIAMELGSRYGYRLRDLGWRALCLLLVPMGTLLYFAYLWSLTGEPTAYFIGQQGWHKSFVPLWYHPVYWITGAELDGQAALDVVTSAFAIAVLIVGYRLVRSSYWVYALVSYLLLMSSSYLLGLPRYLSAVFPIYFMLAALGTRHPAAGRALVAVFAMLAPVVFWVWTNWAYAF